MAYVSSGYLVTDTMSSDLKVIELNFSGTIATGTQVDVAVYQDTTGDGTANNQEQITDVSDGGSYSLSNFERVTGADYWIRFDLSTTDDSNTPAVDSGATVLSEFALVTGSGTTVGPDETTRATESASVTGSGQPQTVSTFARAFESAKLTETISPNTINEIGRTSVGIGTVTASASASISITAIANEHPTVGGQLTTNTVSEITRAVEQASVVGSLSTETITAFTRAIEKDVIVQGTLTADVIYIPPLPKFGISADGSDAQIEYIRTDNP